MGRCVDQVEEMKESENIPIRAGSLTIDTSLIRLEQELDFEPIPHKGELLETIGQLW